MRALPLFHLVAGQPVIVVGNGPAADAKRRLIERAGGVIVDEHDRSARLAFVATDAPDALARQLQAAGLLVNVTDRPDLCDFTVPSVLDRDPLLVAVGTAGASAGLAKHVRLRLEQLLPANLGGLARALERAREAIRARWPEPAGRRAALDEALAAGGVLDPLGENPNVERWLTLAGESHAPEPVELVIGSDDPDDLTLRQARLLGTADAILFEPAIAPAILERARADAVRLPLPHDGPLPKGLVLTLRRS